MSVSVTSIFHTAIYQFLSHTAFRIIILYEIIRINEKISHVNCYFEGVTFFRFAATDHERLSAFCCLLFREYANFLLNVFAL